MIEININDNKYDACITWIEQMRRIDKSWESIKMGNKNDIQELMQFLENKRNDDFWDIDIEEFQAIVEKKRYLDSACKPVSISDQELNDDQDDIKIRKESAFGRYLENLNKTGFSSESIENIKRSTIDILKNLKDSTVQSNPVRGLVMGNVQSGKTANIVGLITLAADQGYNMFIVLSGTIENLREQTENRIHKDLEATSSTLEFKRLSNLSPKVKIDAAANLQLGPDNKKRYVTVCLKNTKRLNDLLKWINLDENKKKKMKVLIIDDEADQAGINTANIDKAKQTKIHKDIKSLVFGGNNSNIIYEYKAMNYIAYTATPYANVLNESGEKTLYPKNFISTLNVSNEYFGPQQIFGTDSVDQEGLSIINEITINDLTAIKKYSKEEIPESLKDAINWFICTVAVFRYWEIKSPVSMLIHTSQRQEDHTLMSQIVLKYFSELSQNEQFLEVIEHEWKKQTTQFNKEIFREEYPEYGRMDNIKEYPKYEDLKTIIHSLVKSNLEHIMLDSETGGLEYKEGIHLCVDNCKSNGIEDEIHLRLAYPESKQNIATAFIVIGGSTLSRGLTLEGLTTTYFVRNTQQADSLMQMGRWFGYRRGYELLPRIWLSDKTRRQFEFLSILDEDLRQEIYDMKQYGKKPNEYGPRINKLPKMAFLRVTGKNKMQNAIEVEGSFDGYKGQTTAMFRDKESIKSNYSNAHEFIKELGSDDKDKFINSFNKDSFVWLGIGYEKVFDFIKKLKYPEVNSVFSNIDNMRTWFDERTKNNEETNWNIIVPGNSKGTEKIEINKKDLYVNNRSIYEDTDLEIMRFGSISDPNAKKMDIDESTIESFNEKDTYKVYRSKASNNQTPLLVIYFINKNSKPRTISLENQMKKRVPLDLENHAVGFELYIPYSNNKNTGGKISVKIEYDIESGDIDGN